MDLSSFGSLSTPTPALTSHSGALPADGETEEAPLLLFRLGESLFGVPALAVREILALPALSSLAETAPFIVGVFNWRGAIVPVMDLNARFERDSPPYLLGDSLIILNWEGAPLALLVSEVRAVSHISRSQIEAPPAHGRASALPAPFVAGVIRGEEGIVMLLHLPHLLHWASDFNRSNPKISFDSTHWTPAERATLQERALRLQSAASEVIGNDDALHNATREAPVAVIALGGEEFGVALSGVREFTSVSAVAGAVASVPCCPPHILGQINLRGDIVTLIDARPALRTAQTAPPFFPAPPPVSPPTYPVVVIGHRDGAVGIVVDDVRDVLYGQGESTVEAAPGVASDQNFFRGHALYQGRLLPLLDVARLLDEGGLEVEENA